jgi:hypothetical protein
MKLKVPSSSPQASYPTFEIYWAERRKQLGAVALSAGLALGSSMLSGCSQSTQLTGPTGSQPQPAQATNGTIRLSGEPAPIVEPEVRLRGDTTEPEPPPPPPPVWKGKIAAPKPPGTPPPANPPTE